MSSTSRSASASGDLSHQIRAKLAHMDIRPVQLIKQPTGDLRPRVKSTGGGNRVASSQSASQSAESPVCRRQRGDAACAAQAQAQKSLLERVTAYVDWKVALLVVVICLALFFAYKKWHLISKLGLGYGIADAGATAVGAAIAGVPQERVEAEIGALRDGTHPVTDVKKPAEAETFVRSEKINELLAAVKITEEPPAATATAPAAPPPPAATPVAAAAAATSVVSTPATPVIATPPAVTTEEDLSVTEQLKRRLQAVGVVGEETPAQS